MSFLGLPPLPGSMSFPGDRGTTPPPPTLLGLDGGGYPSCKRGQRYPDQAGQDGVPPPARTEWQLPPGDRAAAEELRENGRVALLPINSPTKINGIFIDVKKIHIYVASEISLQESREQMCAVMCGYTIDQCTKIL